MKNSRLFFYKLTHWEYWPEEVVFFIPLSYWLCLAMRARSLFFFNAANPGIKNGGMAMESKKEIYDIQPQEFTPRTLFFKPNAEVYLVLKAISNAGLAFPLIAKPDIGLKGMAVVKVSNGAELGDYLHRAKFDFLVQEMVTYPNEIGVFYYRYPDERKGRISAIVKKDFLTVTGDGISAVADLVRREPRYALQMNALKDQYGENLNSVPAKGEMLNLVPFGNHARGAKFTDASSLISQKLTDTFNSFCADIPGFYYGRLDIRYNTFEELEEGKNFSIIELNGAGADPTHILDPDNSIFFAIAEIIRYWRILCDISIINQHKGIPYLSRAEGFEMFRQKKEHIRKLKEF